MSEPPILARRSIRRAARAGVALAALALLMACQVVEPQRTLPSWVRGVYVPMVRNRSFEPGIEELATRFTQEAFLEDGRVAIVPRRAADLTVAVEITDWRDRVVGTSGDRIADRVETTIAASVKLFDPADEETPLADLGTVRVISSFNTDARSTLYQAEPDRRAALLRQLGRQVAYRTIEGFPTALRTLPAGTRLPAVPTDPAGVPPAQILRPREGGDR